MSFFGLTSLLCQCITEVTVQWLGKLAVISRLNIQVYDISIIPGYSLCWSWQSTLDTSLMKVEYVHRTWIQSPCCRYLSCLLLNNYSYHSRVLTHWYTDMEDTKEHMSTFTNLYWECTLWRGLTATVAKDWLQQPRNLLCSIIRSSCTICEKK